MIPTDGVWDMRRDKFYDGIRVEKWAVVVFPSFKYFGEDCLRYISLQCYTISQYMTIYDTLVMDWLLITDFLSFFCRNFVSKLRTASTDCGMQMADPTKVHYFNPRDSVKCVFEMLHSEVRDLQLIVAILDKGTNYSEYLLNSELHRA